MPKVGLCTIAFKTKPLVEVLDVAAVIGFDGVEIWCNEPHFGAPFGAGRAAEVRAAAERRGLAISVLGSYLRLGKGEQEMATVPALLQAAEEMGTKIIRVWAHQKGSAQATPEEWAACVADARQACEMALPKGIMLAMEMHDNTFADRGDSSARLLAETGMPNLKVNYQAGFRPGTDDPMERLERILSDVVNVHAQNFEAMIGDKAKSLKRAPLESGSVAYGALAGRLAAVGYNGYFEIEFVSEPAIEWLEADYRFLRTITQARRGSG